MIRLGPITIIRTAELEADIEVIRAAWPVHIAIWFNQTDAYSELMPLDAELSDALSRVSPEYSPEGMQVTEGGKVVGIAFPVLPGRQTDEDAG